MVDEPEGRVRRAAASRSSKAKAAIEEARRRRKAGELVQEEARIYDELNDEEYAQLVAKRRTAGGALSISFWKHCVSLHKTCWRKVSRTRHA